jgi:hypothetical protein
MRPMVSDPAIVIDPGKGGVGRPSAGDMRR